ncbi:putative alpha/beta-fold hydrolase [Natronospira proteinivora]|uniref:Alpha/beta-fold hydrolase n=1 Tax=Natronospira proteinivora TaxID=1807133 RepID=A0ABT1G6T3_9GAMM|nr:hydrolase [Natronospira proteinivora]MCP1726961.1 putative alpha/beta-fold hydrolase [Natronospira proteinivora]
MITASRFRPAWWARSRHAQTIYQNLLRRRPRPSTRSERLELPDGDFLDLHWAQAQDAAESQGERPIVLLLHGLEGSIQSKYAVGQMQALSKAGLTSVLVHFRGCGGEPNRLRRGYHSGVSDDVALVVRHIRAHFPDSPLAAVGYSLGGNVLLKWLGETGANNPLTTAVAVSVPFRLGHCAKAINKGVSRLYNRFLMRRMKASYARKFRQRSDPPFPLDALDGLKSFHDFDNAITAPLHGFDNASDYYQQASSIHYLPNIRVPTLILHALDDPFMTPDTAPSESEISDQVQLELSPRGGHVGFVAGRWPWKPRWWLEERITAHLIEQFQSV